MSELFVYLAGLLLTAGVYLVLQPQPVRMLFGVVLIGNAVNLGILAVGRAHSAVPPVVPEGLLAPAGPVANPLPQALVLTALVISFGLTAFALALVARLLELGGTTVGHGTERPAESAAEDGPEPAVRPDPVTALTDGSAGEAA